MEQFTPAEYWKALVLYGLNQATYKIALGKVLLELAAREQTLVTWEALAVEFLNQYQIRLSTDEAMPQQANPARLTEMERIVFDLKQEALTSEQAVDQVSQRAFRDVTHRFHNLGSNQFLAGTFYELHYGKKLVLKESLLGIVKEQRDELTQELNARWSLLEGAFSIASSNQKLKNDLRKVYLTGGTRPRKALTDTIPFLQGYQANTCFYCGEPLVVGDTHVDHVLPRQVVNHDEIWNLVLSHRYCNESKSDKLVGEHFIRKLIIRNENIMGSNHPWKQRIAAELGRRPAERKANLYKHFQNVREILGGYYWQGSHLYDPSKDPFFRRLITILNNPGLR